MNAALERDDLIAQIKALTEANAILTDHIARLHNSVRHKFSAAVEAAADEAFREMAGITALREAREAKAADDALAEIAEENEAWREDEFNTLGPGDDE